MINTDSSQKNLGWTLVIVNDEQFSYDTHHVTNIAKYFDDIKFKIKSKYLQYQ